MTCFTLTDFLRRGSVEVGFQSSALERAWRHRFPQDDRLRQLGSSHLRSGPSLCLVVQPEFQPFRHFSCFFFTVAKEAVLLLCSYVKTTGLFSFHKIRRKGGRWVKEETMRFSWQSTSGNLDPEIFNGISSCDLTAIFPISWWVRWFYWSKRWWKCWWQLEL